ncbi:MAG: GAF domain-containing sensor histidine kinase [Magnetospirillum sp.]|nr:GAF domain-containing sensor histidine kinase [Magnetospirillum sp.]
MPVALAAEAPEVDTLIALVRDLAQASDRAEITTKVTRAVRHLTGADGATFVMKEGECCYYADEDSASPLWKGQRFPAADCISGRAMDEHATQIISDIRTEKRLRRSAYTPTFVRSMVVAPVRTAAPVAAIGAYWAQPKQFCRAEIATVETIAHAAALALQNLELVNSLRVAADTKARLLAAVGHDLRQPMQSLALFASVLEGEAQTPAARQAASHLNASVDRMANLLSSIIALADLDSGSVTVNRQAVTVDSLLAPLEAELGTQAKAKDIRFVRVPCSAQVVTDPGLMTAVLRNLGSNAVRYTQHGKVLMGGLRRGDRVEVVVADTGIGIEPAQQASIFEEFYQVGNQGRDFTAGTGVGLAMVRRLVDILGHRIRLQSMEGRGSLFTVALPAA